MNARRLKQAGKAAADAVALLVAAPFGAASYLERFLRPGAEGVFQACAHMLALAPGLPGMYVRRAFYRLALDDCHSDCFIGFGTVCTHREVVVERGVHIGVWALIGSSHLREGTSIGSRASLLSGTELHEFRDGRWTPMDRARLRQIVIGPHAFVGEAAVVMADVERWAMVAAGAVVSAAVPAGVAVAGNPARFVRRVVADVDEPVGSGS
jgi:virginiamycin A acetyltransferase